MVPAGALRGGDGPPDVPTTVAVDRLMVADDGEVNHAAVLSRPARRRWPAPAEQAAPTLPPPPPHVREGHLGLEGGRRRRRTGP